MTQDLQTAPLTLGWCFAQLDESHRKDALNNLAEWGDWYFNTLLKAGMDALGFVRPEPAFRLGYYKIKTPQEWAEQRAKFPDDFTEEQDDFDKLLEREARGDLVAAVLRRPGPEMIPADVIDVGQR